MDRSSQAARLPEIQAEIGRLQADLAHLATRDEMSALERSVRALADDLLKSRSRDGIAALAGAVADLHGQVRTLSRTGLEDLHQRLSAEIAGLAARLDQIAGATEPGLEAMNAQVADLRRALARLADPQRLDALSHDVAELGRHVAEMRLQQAGAHQAGSAEMAALKGALDEIRASTQRAEDLASASPVPDQLQSLSRRLDLLMSRPEPARLDPLVAQIKALTDEMAGLTASRSEPVRAVAAVLDRLSGDVRSLSAEVAAGPDRVLARIDRLDETVRGADHAGEILSRFDRLHDAVESVARAASPALLVSRFDRLDEAVRQAGASAPPERLAAQFDGLRASLREAVEAAKGDEILGRFDRLDAAVRGSDGAERILARIDRLEETVQDAAPARPAEVEARFDRLEEAVRQIGEVADNANLELMLRAVGDKLERGAGAISLDALEEKLEALRRRVAEEVAEPVQQALQDTLAQVKALRGEAAMIAERAARSVLKEAGAPAGDVDALKRGFEELKALHATAEKKTQATLKAVHNALETLVARLPAGAAPADGTPADAPFPDGPVDPASARRLEAAVRKLHRAATSQAEEIVAGPASATPPRRATRSSSNPAPRAPPPRSPQPQPRPRRRRAIRAPCGRTSSPPPAAPPRPRARRPPAGRSPRRPPRTASRRSPTRP